MFGLDPLNPLTALTEILLLLLLAAFVGWVLGRLLLNGRVSRLRQSIRQKEAELEACRQAKGLSPAVDKPASAPEPTLVIPAYVEADPLLPALNGDATPHPVADQPIPSVASAAPVPIMTTGAAGNSEAAVLNRIAARAHELNFDRIGRATAAEADDLKDIVGVGPFLERKLHSLGIYTFRQVANFTQEDIIKVNEIIEFFPGRIERDNWVGQAKSFHERKYGARS
ncbi:hypothetical protein DYU11_13140 [Fibrisoma montanum]|uniref:DUF4332 domain-containing protein n=1 Tax=Fibrisoma montanum TaxID=2305895 RepID=A0A418MC06_9BACT|nr:hypothetical protein [Fibrisoma montanum]RIV23904.1 hypothetical protein DYU11_13140 [Fibrisoma montanum]